MNNCIFELMNDTSAAGKSFFTLQFALLCFSNFLFSASFNMMIPELPGYLTRLGGAEYKGLIISLFTLMAGISRPFSGKLTDTIGRVPVMIFGSFICVACSLLYPVLTTISGFLLLRFVHGFSTGFKPTATSAYGADVVHESRRGEALAALATGYSLGSSTGPLIGSYLTAAFSYNVMFYASALSALGSVAILYNVRETLKAKQKFRLSLLRISRSEIFDRTAIQPAIIMFLLSFPLGTVLTLAPDFSESIGLKNKGFFYAAYTIASLLIRFVAGKSSDRYGRIPVLLISSFVQMAGYLLLSVTHTIPMLLLSAVVIGISLGMNGPTLIAWAVDRCEPQYRGRAVASVYIALEAGIGGGALISAWIYNNHAANFVYAFLLPSLLALVSMLLLWRWNKKEQRKSETTGFIVHE
jgi:MFS family permease